MFPINHLRIPLHLLLVARAIEPFSVLVDIIDQAHRRSEQLRIQQLQNTSVGVEIEVNDPLEALKPRIEVPFHQDDLGVRVRIDELFGETKGGQLRHGAVVAQQLIPLLSRQRVAVVVVFGFKGGCPEREMVGVGEQSVTVVGGVAAENLKSGLHGDCAGTTYAQGKDLHWDGARAGPLDALARTAHHGSPLTERIKYLVTTGQLLAV